MAVHTCHLADATLRPIGLHTNEILTQELIIMAINESKVIKEREILLTVDSLPCWDIQCDYPPNVISTFLLMPCIF